jgi:hypothetical protein
MFVSVAVSGTGQRPQQHRHRAVEGTVERVQQP